MAERPEDLNLPITVVQRIIKEALPDGVIVSKESRQTISRASSVFVLYLTACAVTHANKAKRKTLAVNDIIAALSDMEFDSFIQSLNDSLKERKLTTAQSAKNKANSKADKADAVDQENEVEEIEADGDDVEPEAEANNDENENENDNEVEED